SGIALCLLQGCIPMATGVISYSAAVSSQEHSAYSDYILASQQKNQELAKAGQEPLPILTRDKWRQEIHQPHLDYSDFVDGYLKTNKSIAQVISYEEWKGTEYPRLVAQMSEAYQKPSINLICTGKKAIDQDSASSLRW